MSNQMALRGAAADDRTPWVVPVVLGALVVLVPLTPGGHWAARFSFGCVTAIVAHVEFARSTATGDAIEVLGPPRARAGGEFALFCLIALGGVYACAPETDHLKRLALGLLIVIVAEWVTGSWIDRRVFGLIALVLLGMAAYSGAAYRGTAVVASVGCLALISIRLPSERLPGPPEPLLPIRFQRLGTVGLHALGCLTMARTAGMAGGVGIAVIIAIVVTVAVAFARRVSVGPGDVT